VHVKIVIPSVDGTPHSSQQPECTRPFSVSSDEFSVQPALANQSTRPTHTFSNPLNYDLVTLNRRAQPREILRTGIGVGSLTRGELS
jgi:hypothetical protein